MFLKPDAGQCGFGFCFVFPVIFLSLSSQLASKQQISSCIPVENLLPVCRDVKRRATGSLFCLQNFKTWIYEVINSSDSSNDVYTGLFSRPFFTDLNKPAVSEHMITAPFLMYALNLIYHPLNLTEIN